MDLPDGRSIQLVEKVPVGATLGPPVDFAKAKSIAARRKYGYFPSRNPKNYVFRRASEARPYNSFREAGSLTV
jgi:hypothetical protein